MAERIEGELPDRRKERAIYDWDNWLDGSVWKLQRGVDFTVRPESFRAVAANQAKRTRKYLSASVDGDTIYIQARPKEQPK